MKHLSILLLLTVTCYVVARPKLEEENLENGVGLSKMDSAEIESFQNVVDGPIQQIPESEDGNGAVEGSGEEEATTTTTTVAPRKTKSKKHKKHHRRRTTTTTEAPSEEYDSEEDDSNSNSDSEDTTPSESSEPTTSEAPEDSKENAEDFLDMAGPLPELNDFENQLNLKEVKFDES
ncbi:unnamed protein product [Bursaphelenchus okinawaensis]|uniref:Uncharacterized protein n=1 Tax=Bursaphelenchus okinawaensis TaxID=465554 RepID=A0A811KM48_9BILA|nr:unnamed protein product [Bursaphelenchus okinawaensis]CAG9105079.1 unnamed protein product [Bursaphelenchus okinawaensis]